MVDPAHKAEPSCHQERARSKLDSERRWAGDEGARARGAQARLGNPPRRRRLFALASATRAKRQLEGRRGLGG